MSDMKSNYSNTSKKYVDISKSTRAYNNSINRQLKYGANWDKQKVNINEIVEKFCNPLIRIKENAGVKVYYVGHKNTIICDKATGYLRIKDNSTKQFLDINGNVNYHRDATHFRIKQREEM